MARIPKCKMSVSGKHAFNAKACYVALLKKWLYDLPKCEYCGLVDDTKESNG